MTRCEDKSLSGYPQCALPSGHTGGHEYPDGQCPATKDGRQCQLAVEHNGPHEKHYTITQHQVWT